MSNLQIRKTKIVATLGPACHDVDILTKMIEAGMNCARFNFSHGDHKEHLERLNLLKKAIKITKKPIAVMLDTKGPEIRTGYVEGDDIELIAGKKIIVSGLTHKTTKDTIALSYSRIHKEAPIGTLIKIADGSMAVQVESIEEKKLICKVIRGGLLGSKKNVNISNAKINLPSLIKKDIDDINFAIEHKFDFIAASFIRKAEDVIAIKEILTEHDSKIKIISKIENQEGLDNLESIAQLSDGIMVARGDLAEQIQPAEIPLRQKSIIKTCNKYQKIVITATQMLQSMEESMNPTRAELTDVANAIFDGTDAVMLSGESAKGKFPIDAVETMDRVALTVERSDQFREHAHNTFFANRSNLFAETSSAGESVIAAAQIVANKSNASAFACPSLSGNTPSQISCLRPVQPIVATSHNEHICRQLLLMWGVIPVHTKKCESDTDLIKTTIDASKELGLLEKNDKLVIIAGLPINKPLMINTIQVHFNGTVVLRGRQGCGPIVKGKVHYADSATQILQHASENKTEQFIYIIPKLTYNMLPALSEISAIIVQNPAEIPLIAIEKQFPHLSCLANVGDLTFQKLANGNTIVISGQEKFAYEP